MKIDWLPDRGASRWLEPVFAVLTLVFLGYAMWFLRTFGYLPAPFFYDVADTYMDWFNTAFFGRYSGTYDDWRTIYPPISFIFLRIFGIDRCYDAYPPWARDCDWLGRATIHGFYILDVILLALIYRKVNKKTALCRSVAMGAGLPLTFAYDRGNLVIVCFAFYILAYGPLLRSARLRWIAAGLAINFKVYLVAALFTELLRRRWRWFEGALIATFAIYVASFGILGLGTPSEIYANLINFSVGGISINYFDLWYTSTYHAVLSLLDGPFPMMMLIGSRPIEFWTTALPIYQHVVQALIVLACAAAWLRPEVVPMHRLTYFGVTFALLTQEAGGYTQVFFLYFVFFEAWRGIGRKVALMITYVLCVPWEYTLVGIEPIRAQLYLSGSSGYAAFGVGIGLFVRPGLLLALALTLSLVTIRDVWADIRALGWQGRRRFRHDLPLMTWGGHRLPGGVTPSPV